jgi:hypothetical protein
MRPEIKLLRALFVAYLIATAVHIGWVIAHEPFSFDAWNVAQDTAGKPITLGRFFSYWKLEYTHSNPRIGQVFTYLSYKLDLFAVIATPLAYLALSLAVTVLGLGRWPRRGRELALWAFVVGAQWFALPEIGKMMFCRAYSANYVYTAALQLWFLVPLRLARDGQASRGASGAYFVAGVLAGACNEHTGPTLCLALVLYALWTQRRTQVIPRLAWAGAAGAIVGFAAIFFAPGQGERYGGLAHKAGIVGRIIQRGLGRDLDILLDVVRYGAPVFALLFVLALLAGDAQAAVRRTLAAFAPVLAAVVLVALTMFASPKQGPRFYYVSMSLLLAGLVAVADHVLTSSRRIAPFVVLAVLASGYAAFRTIPLYLTMSHQSAERIAGLEAAPPGSVYVADAFLQTDESWWSLGDDFRATDKREMVRQYFGLAGVVWRAYDPYVPLGVTTARLVPRIDPPVADTFALGSFKGFDFASMHREIQVAIAMLRQRSEIRGVDVAVELPEVAVTWPRPALLVGRWTPERYEGYEATITRESGKTRAVKLPAQLRDAEVFVYLVGGDLKRLGTGSERLHYIPWKPGVYWVLACRADACFVVAGSRH